MISCRAIFISAGANVTYVWNFTHVASGFSTLQTNLGVPSATVNLTPRGFYTVSVRAYNLLSDKTDNANFTLQDSVRKHRKQVELIFVRIIIL